MRNSRLNCLTVYGKRKAHNSFELFSFIPSTRQDSPHAETRYHDPYDDSSKTRFGTWPHRFALQSSYGQAISWSIVLSLGDPLRRFRRLKGLPAAERPSMRSPRSIRRDWYCCGGNRLAFPSWRCAIPVPMGPGSRCSIHIRE